MIIRLSAGDRWFVYVIEDNTGAAFYVGMTENPHVRAGQHITRRGPVQDRIREIEAEGGTVRMRVLVDCATKREAQLREMAEMRRRPGLLNMAGYRGAYPRSRANQALLDEGAEK